MQYVSLIFSLLVMFCSASIPMVYASPGQIELVLKPEVSVLGRNYYLGDLVSITYDKQALSRQLLTLKIGQSPRPGYSVYVSRHEIAALAERQMPGVYRRLSWSGAEKIKIIAGGVSFASDRLLQVAETFLYKQLRNQYQDFRIKAVQGEIKDIIVPDGKVNLTAGFGGKSAVDKRTCVWLDIEVENIHFATVPIWFEVSVFENVLVSDRQLDKLTILTDSMVSWALRDVASVGGTPVKSFIGLEYMRVMKTLSAGEIVLRENIENVPPVSKDQRVTVYTHLGSVGLKTIGIALHDAHLNEEVRIKNPQTFKTYIAVVTDSAYVRVE